MEEMVKDRFFIFSTFIALLVFLLFICTYLFSMLWYTSWGSFWEAFLSEEILLAIQLSLTTAFVATSISMVLAVPAAYFLARREFFGKALIDTFLDLPLVLPPVALGLALLVALSTPLGQTIQEYGINFVFERPGIVLAQFAVVSSFALRLMKSTFDNISPRYERVARTLGASSWQAFRRVTLPLSKNGLLAASVLTLTRSLGEFGATITLVGAMKKKTEVFSVAIWLNLAVADINKAIAVVFILILVSGVTLWLLRKLVGRGYSL